MAKRPLKRSLEYQARVRRYAENLAERYRVEVAETFLERIEAAERLLYDNNFAGTDSPHLLAGQQVVLKELFIDSGPVKYCLIYELTEEYVGLVSLWHGVGSRKTDMLIRLWGTNR
ncbi:hypothetical protein KIP69_11830 [Geobacter sulfurreducens]|uniref:hypothetical protein n=1 Tax=Geobacter sulfurreducens TaxID=35554 RepID=UPI001BDBD54E|nr:hypothetical protein [Geobacter sulfurreducens]QVW34280.1 hypothetical protein KIP69_11830 [Geobacter sulfurreducens]UTG91797.1 hypothetical protein J8622_12260 [Geobacter sulfurreducens]